jgi:hypothetical protein
MINYKQDLSGEVLRIQMRGFLRRMLNYYDPLGTIALGAPFDEYDGDIDKIIVLVNEAGSSVGALAELIFKFYEKDATDITALRRSSHRMAEDILENNSNT